MQRVSQRQFWRAQRIRSVALRHGVHLSDAEAEEAADDVAQGAGIQALIDALREYGIAIPEEVQTLRGLVIAIKAAHSAGLTCDDDDDDDDYEDTRPQNDPRVMPI